MLLADSGYQGIEKYHAESFTPVKKQKGKPLIKEANIYNHVLSKQRIFVEHIHRRCKIFRIVKEVYRGKHKHYSLTWHLIAAMVNLRYSDI